LGSIRSGREDGYVAREKLRAAVVGTGLVGMGHARSYANSELVELVYVCDLIEDRAKEAASRFECEYTLDYGDIASSDVDIVSIVTPDFAHTAPAMAMLDAGKHVLTEKPLTTSLNEASQLVAKAREKGLTLSVNLGMRFQPSHRRVKELLEGGALGEPVCVYSNSCNAISIPTQMLPSWATYSGPQWFKLSHTIDLLRWLLGRPICKEVYAQGRKGKLSALGIDAYDALHALVSFDSGAWITFDTAWVQPDAWQEDIETYFVLTGTEGMVKAKVVYGALDPREDHLVVATHGSPLETRVRYKGYQPGSHMRPKPAVSTSIAHFVECVMAGEEPIVTPEDGQAVVAIISAIERSIHEGQPVPVGY
jgi:predicted dehydrogenase